MDNPLSVYKTVGINIAGGSIKSRSKIVSVADLVNMYPESTPEGISNAALIAWPGNGFLASPNITETWKADRGIHVFNGVLYRVIGASLYRVDDVGAITGTIHTRLGGIYGTQYCGFSNNGEVMLVTTGGPVYQYDGAALSIVSGITFNPSWVTYLNKKFIFDSNSNFFWHTDPGNLNIDPLNFAEPESNPDPYVLPYAFGQVLYLFGTKSIEPFQDVGEGNPSFERISGSIIENIGCSSYSGVTNTVNAVYFISTSGIAYRLRSFQVEEITTPSMAVQLQDLQLDNYIANTVSFDNQNFIIFHFPSDNKTWVFSESTARWFRLEVGNNGDRWACQSYAFVNGIHAVADIDNGTLYKLDFEQFQSYVDGMPRRVTFPFFSGERADDIRGYFTVGGFRLGIETGTALVSGVHTNPVAMFRYSIDGKTWSAYVQKPLGTQGDFNIEVNWKMLPVRCRQITAEVVIQAPIAISIISAAWEVRK